MAAGFLIVSEAPRPQGGASRRGSFVHVVPLDPAYKAGLAGHVPAMVIANRGRTQNGSSPDFP